jgi:Asp-tRNA(Asn)/Glu-tRNA(Gln) amidotransferase A subunit family amidase
MKTNFFSKSFLLFIIISISAFTFFTTELVKITKNDIPFAEKIIGLEFSDAERDSMADALNENLESFIKNRQLSLTNEIPPAISFNPLPIGFSISQKQNKLIFSNYTSVKLPANINELAFYSIGELAQLIKTRKISSVKLTRFFIDRLKKFSPNLFNVITITEERAYAEAEKADLEIKSGKYRGMLHGIPYGVKDLLSTKNYKTTWGASPFKDQLIDEDAEVIKKLSNSGAVLVAKFSMGELAWGDVWFGGITRNPWDTTKGSSGSSAGSASAVSAGLVPFAIGTETWGSIVSPSTVCGVSGLRPTYGRVSRTGAMALSWSMDKIGTICRNVEDLAIVFNSIYGKDIKDQTLINAPFNYSHKIDFSKLKIGYLKNDFDKKYPFHSQDSVALKQLEKLGAKLIPIELPTISNYDISFILTAEAGAAFDELTRSNKDDQLVRQIKNAWPNVFRSSRFIPAVEYINANRIRFLLIQQMNEMIKDLDFYVSPSWIGNNLLVTNLTGHPSVVVPTGFSKAGTPTSFTFIGKLFDEGTIIAAAKKYQDETTHHKKHPPLFSK